MDTNFLAKEAFEKCSILVKIKKGDNFNHRNILNISRIKIWAWRRDWADKRRLRKGAFFKGLKFSEFTYLVYVRHYVRFVKYY